MPTMSDEIQSYELADSQGGTAVEGRKWEKHLPDNYLTADAVDKYQEAFVFLKNSPYVEYPQIVSLETLASCNAVCNFCPYPALERKGARMSDQLIAKILRDLEDIPKNVPFFVTLARINEPFLDKRLLSVARTINDRLPHASLILFSNVSPLINATLDQLAQLERVFVLSLSLNDHRRDQYEEIMRIPYARTMERLDTIHQRVVDGSFPIPIRVSRVADGTPVDEEFISFVHERWPRFDVVVYRKSDWLGAVETPYSPVPDIGCQQWFTMSFLANGKESFCAMDSDGSFASGGDVATEHVLSLYNHPSKRRLREQVLSRLTVDPCKRCSLMS